MEANITFHGVVQRRPPLRGPGRAGNQSFHTLSGVMVWCHYSTISPLLAKIDTIGVNFHLNITSQINYKTYKTLIIKSVAKTISDIGKIIDQF